jgi:hypothetical protein
MDMYTQVKRLCTIALLTSLSGVCHAATRYTFKTLEPPVPVASPISLQ